MSSGSHKYNSHDAVVEALDRTIKDLQDQRSLAQRAAMGEPILWRQRDKTGLWGPWQSGDCDPRQVAQYVDMPAMEDA